MCMVQLLHYIFKTLSVFAPTFGSDIYFRKRNKLLFRRDGIGKIADVNQRLWNDPLAG